jgi:hypothetical protein
MKNKIYVLLGFLLIGIALEKLAAQEIPGKELGLYGNSGAVFTPSGYLVPDRQLSFGVSYVPQGYSQINRREPLWKGDRVIFANLGLLPFLEVTFRLTSPDGSKNNFGIGDRSLFLRGRITKEKKYLPAIAIGIHDGIGIVGYHHAAYVVASKSWILNNDSQILFSGGYGTKIDNRASNTYLQGVFGNVSWQWKPLTLNLEYDAKKVNAALKLRLLKVIVLNAALIDLKKITGGVNLQFMLLK